jgi:protein-L-isoaspartate O-methyltransferase
MINKLDIKGIQDAIRKKYAEISSSADGKFNYSTGRNGAISLGYDMSIVESMPNELIESFCGVGNPFTLGPIKSGMTVLDIGCGAGFDLIYASRMVGNTGKVCGIDLTPEMVEKAKLNLKRYGVSNYDVQ